MVGSASSHGAWHGPEAFEFRLGRPFRVFRDSLRGWSHLLKRRAATSLEPADRVVPLATQMIGLRVTANSGRVGLASELTSRVR